MTTKKGKRVSQTRGVQIIDVKLIASSYETNQRYRSKKLRSPICTPLYSYTRNGERLVCTLTVDLTHGKQKAPFQASVTYRATYCIGENAEVNVKKFAQYTAPAHLFPYVREHVADLTNRGLYPSYIMQPVNMARFLLAASDG